MPPTRSTRSWQRRAMLNPSLLILPLIAGLTACSTTADGGPVNRSLYSVHQPVVDRTTYTLDLAVGAGGMRPGEEARLDAWLGALGTAPGDTLALDGPADRAALGQIAAVTGRHGLLAGASVPAIGTVPPGSIRVAVTRHRAYVPGCPDWTDRTASQLDNRTSNNYGCGVNGNMAAMVADPQDLLRGRSDTGNTQVMTANRGIDAWRKRTPGAAGELPRATSAGGVSGGGQ
ncbi:CpaD family pilus assembly lipoprotein [Croceibacterium sp. TMG7-5b_MA50]|uniref:CpaD family pilus assembly protein n=1 Tax=Croceibacterium sp. TMG7-5b_MA50 TaxID=3121290 RepID=UPI003221B371